MAIIRDGLQHFMTHPGAKDSDSHVYVDGCPACEYMETGRFRSYFSRSYHNHPPMQYRERPAAGGGKNIFLRFDASIVWLPFPESDEDREVIV